MDRAGGDPGAAADHEHRARVFRHERREVAQHPLQPHVLGRARCLDLAGIVIPQLAGGQP
jgi:hypothetical protein